MQSHRGTYSHHFIHTGVTFEECYKEYLPGYVKLGNNSDPFSPLQQTFYNPVATHQSAVTTITEQHSGLQVPSSGPRVPSAYSRPLPQNGFNHALDLANFPITRMGGNFDYPSSLTQPEPYHHSGNPYTGQLGYSSSTQFDFPIPPHTLSHPTATTGGGGLTPISELIPPVMNTSSTNPGVPSGITTGDSFAEFFPALLAENPLNDASSADSKRSVSDLFNLTAGLDLPPNFNATNQEGKGIGVAAMNKDGAVDTTWNQPMAASDHSNNNSSSLQNNERGPPIVHGSKEMNVSEGTIDNQSHTFGRMDSFGFSPSVDVTVPGFDADGGTPHKPTQASGAVSDNLSNWSDYVRIPNFESSSVLFNPATSDIDNNNSGELDLPRMPNTEPYVLGKSAQVGTDQNADGTRTPPKGKKKKKKKGSKSSSSDQSGKGMVNNANAAGQAQEPGECTTSDDSALEASVKLTEEESVGSKGQESRHTSYGLSSASVPNLIGSSSAPGFRSEGHTPPPIASEITANVTNSTTIPLKPFTDKSNSTEDIMFPESSNLAGGSIEVEHQQPLESNESGFDDIFDGELRIPSELSSVSGETEGRSTLLNYIMAARANTEQESSTRMQGGHPDGFKSAAVPVFKRIKDIEDESSQESEENNDETELSVAHLKTGEIMENMTIGNSVVPTEEICETEESMATGGNSDIPKEEICETVENVDDQNPLQPEFVSPDTVAESVEPEDPSPHDEVAVSEDKFVVADTHVTESKTIASTGESCKRVHVCC